MENEIKELRVDENTCLGVKESHNTEHKNDKSWRGSM